jgi:predicted MFS family arabinose efflux permease
LIFSASQFAQFCAVLIMPLLFRGVGTQARIIGTQVVGAAAVFALGISHTASYAVVCYLVYTAVQFSAGPGFYGMLMSRTPEEDRSTSSAIQNVVGSLAAAGSAALTGALVVRYGYSLVFNLNAILAGLVVLLVCVCFGRSSTLQPMQSSL